MRQHAKQRVHRKATPGKRRDRHRHRQRHCKGADKDRGRKRQSKRHAKDCRMRGCVTEIGHPPPDHEAAQRGRGKRHAKPGKGGAHHEIVKQGHSAASCG